MLDFAGKCADDIRNGVFRIIGFIPRGVRCAEIHRAVFRERDPVRVFEPGLAAVQRILLEGGIFAEHRGQRHAAAGGGCDIRGDFRHFRRIEVDVGDRVADDFGFVSGGVDRLEVNDRIFPDGNAVNVCRPFFVPFEPVLDGIQLDVVRKNGGQHDGLGRGRRRTDLNARQSRGDGIGFAADGEGKRAVRQRQQVSRAADVSHFAELKGVERFARRILNGDRAVDPRRAFREHIRAVCLRAGDREHIFRRSLDEGKIVDAGLRPGRESGNVNAEDRTFVSGNDRAVRESHPAGQHAFDFKNAAVNRNVTCRAAFVDVGFAALVDCCCVCRAAAGNIEMTVGIDRRRVCRAAAGNKHDASIRDRRAVRRAAGHDVHFLGNAERHGIHRRGIGEQDVVRTVVDAGICARKGCSAADFNTDVSFARSPDDIRRRAAVIHVKFAVLIDGDAVRQAAGDVETATLVDGGVARNAAVVEVQIAVAGERDFGRRRAGVDRRGSV